MFKTVGIILICTSLSIAGASKAESLSLRARLRKELMNLLMYLESSIKYTSKPIDKIISDFDSPMLSQYNLPKADSKLNKDLSDDEAKEIFDFFDELGKAHTTEKALSLCKKCQDSLSLFDSQRTKKDIDKASLYRKLGIILAILTAIILI